MKKILNDLYQHKKLSKSEAKKILLEIADSRYNEAHLASFMTSKSTIGMDYPILILKLQP